MMTLEYRLICNRFEGKSSYGIALYRCGKIAVSIPEISQNRQDIERLTSLLNELKAEPCHFEDIVEDYLTDFSL